MAIVQMMNTGEILHIRGINGWTQHQTWKCPVCGDIRFVNRDPSPCPICQSGQLTQFPGHTSDEDLQPGTAAQTVTTRVCAICGTDITHRRHQTQTCSAKCRKALSRHAKAVNLE